MTNNAPDKLYRHKDRNGLITNSRIRFSPDDIEYTQADKAKLDIRELCTHLARVLSIVNSTGSELSPDLDIYKVINDATDMLLKHDDKMEYVDPRDELIQELVDGLSFVHGELGMIYAGEERNIISTRNYINRALAEAKKFLADTDNGGNDG